MKDGPKIRWRSFGRSIGYIRGGVYYIERTIRGRRASFSTGCVTQTAALAEYRKFEKSPTLYVSPRGWRLLGRAPANTTSADARRRSFQKKYRLSDSEYDALYHAQGGCCLICNRRAEDSNGGVLSVDHCHETGEVRGLLCAHCNRGLGHFLDSEVLLRAAADYLAARRKSGVPRATLVSAK